MDEYNHSKPGWEQQQYKDNTTHNQTGNPYNQNFDFTSEPYGFNTQPIHNFDESGFDYKYDKESLDQQEVNSGDGAKDQIEPYRLEEEKVIDANQSITVSDPHQT